MNWWNIEENEPPFSLPFSFFSAAAGAFCHRTTFRVLHGGGKKVSSDRGQLWRSSERNLVLKQRQTSSSYLPPWWWCRCHRLSPGKSCLPRVSHRPSFKDCQRSRWEPRTLAGATVIPSKNFPQNFTKHFPQNLLLNSLYVQCNIFMTWWWKRVWRYDDRMMMLVMIEWWSYADVSDD